MTRYGWQDCVCLALFGILVSSGARAADATASNTGYSPPLLLRFNDTDHPAPADYGPGAGLRPRSAAAEAATSFSGTIPNGGPTAYLGGFFGPAVNWPIIPLHEVLLPDGRVMNYGTGTTGSQGAALVYDVWDPSLGTGTNSQLVLTNTTGTDIFCSAQSLLWNSDQVLISGGDLTVNGQRNFSQNKTTIFSPQTNTIAAGTSMQYPRWYDSMVPLPTGEMLVSGGRTAPGAPAITPEVFSPTSGWRTLTGATSDAAFGSNATNWFYPRGFVSPSGAVFMLAVDGTMYSLTTAGAGTIAPFAQTTFGGTSSLPTLMFAPGRVLSIRSQARTVVVNISGATPVVTQVGNISQDRIWSSGTVLPDGRVVVTGGSLIDNTLTGVSYEVEVWNPTTGNWTMGASATKPRLYHSTALLLPDATVLTGGGGAPGPVNELNAEIYYPSYLYRRDGSGLAASRPTLATAPAVVNVGQSFTATVGSADVIGAVSFVRSGSVTHSANLDQRFLKMSFTQSGATLTVQTLANRNVLLPGYYMMFALNKGGTPSIAKMVLVLG